MKLSRGSSAICQVFVLRKLARERFMQVLGEHGRWRHGRFVAGARPQRSVDRLRGHGVALEHAIDGQLRIL